MWNKSKYILFTFLCILMLTTHPDLVTATETENATGSSTEMETIIGIYEKSEAGIPTFQTQEPPALSKSSKKTKITWSDGGYDTAKIYGYKVSYELQCSTSKKFTKSTTKSFYTTKTLGLTLKKFKPLVRFLLLAEQR